MSGRPGNGRPSKLQITRCKRQSRFIYLRGKQPVRDPQLLKRLRQLAIPPAWHDVRISASATSKVQARGVDDAGRTQRIYHPAFRRRREARKFSRLAEIGKALPGLREQVARDLNRRGLPPQKVIAAVVRLLDLHLLRIGTPRYARHYGSFGATTLRRRHIRVFSHRVEIDFNGKSGQRQCLAVTDPALVRVLGRLNEQPGHEVFRIRQESGTRRTIGPQDVNDYLHEHAGPGFSAKDFRTWGGTLIALSCLLDSDLGPQSTQQAARKMQLLAVSQAAAALGNTAATARNAYIAPQVLELATDLGKLDELRSWRSGKRQRKHQPVAERCLLQLLEARPQEPPSHR